MAHVRINETVWCNTGKPSYELDGNFVGTVVMIDDDKYSVMEENNPFGLRTYIADISQLTTLSPQLIDDKIVGILKSVVTYQSTESEVNIGWVCRYDESKEETKFKKDAVESYAVKYWFRGRYEFVVECYRKDKAMIKLIIEQINDKLNCNPESDIVARYMVNGLGTLNITFFKLNLNDKVKSNKIEMTESMRSSMLAIDKFMSFGLCFETTPYAYLECGNYMIKQLPTFIIDAKWTCGIDNIIEMWETAVKCRRPSSYMTNFYELLSPPDRQALIEWVVLNYKSDEANIFCD